MDIFIRIYNKKDLAAIAELFYKTVHSVNAKDYNEAQLRAWADGNTDLVAWDQSFQRNYSLVVFFNGELVGFGDIDTTGYLDRLYVHENYQRQGIATALCERLEEHAAESGLFSVTTHASVTAKPFFEKRNYKTLQRQQVERHGILLTNYAMQKDINKNIYK